METKSTDIQGLTDALVEVWTREDIVAIIEDSNGMITASDTTKKPKSTQVVMTADEARNLKHTTQFYHSRAVEDGIGSDCPAGWRNCLEELLSDSDFAKLKQQAKKHAERFLK
jgi:hypothetical protein